MNLYSPDADSVVKDIHTEHYRQLTNSQDVLQLQELRLHAECSRYQTMPMRELVLVTERVSCNVTSTCAEPHFFLRLNSVMRRYGGLGKEQRFSKDVLCMQCTELHETHCRGPDRRQRTPVCISVANCCAVECCFKYVDQIFCTRLVSLQFRVFNTFLGWCNVTLTKRCHHFPTRIMSFKWPPLWSSGQSSWLQIQRSEFDSLHCQIFWEVVGLERGPHSLVSTI
jgi:hypothetical protein